ncbi:MAG: flavin reductase family protein [Rhodobacteraceae bacterium]|nr:flavin reductase family protein [Paracoccaceae bacterium]
MFSFSPPNDPNAFRNALGAFATGVTVVTVAGPNGPEGMTANSFASVSLDPPLVLWSPARNSRRFELFANAPHFAIHVLAADQKQLCATFARRGDPQAPPPAIDWETGPNGLPVLAGCLARFICARHSAHDGGDHLILLGHVLHAQYRSGAPLLFQAGNYGQLHAPDS